MSEQERIAQKVESSADYIQFDPDGCDRIAAADELRDIAKELRALPPAERQGWVTVTDDETTWPPDVAGPKVLMEYRQHHDGKWRSEVYADSENARRGVQRMMLPPVQYDCRWHPWPTTAPAAHDAEAEGLLRELQWAASDGPGFRCPLCHGIGFHMAACRLAALLARRTGAEGES